MASEKLGGLRLVPTAAGKRGRGETDVRWSRVKAARARIAAGFYEHDEVREKLLDALLDELADR
jgi:anti-sigma28 factor (negative regulator of flagellin synthesis)